MYPCGCLLNRLDRADLVIHMHHRNQYRILAHGCLQFIQRDPSLMVNRKIGHLIALLLQKNERIVHGCMLDSRRDDMSARTLIR